MDAVICYSFLPSDSLRYMVAALCHIINKPRFCDHSWEVGTVEPRMQDHPESPTRVVLKEGWAWSACSDLCRSVKDKVSEQGVLERRGMVFHRHLKKGTVSHRGLKEGWSHIEDLKRDGLS